MRGCRPGLEGVGVGGKRSNSVVDERRGQIRAAREALELWMCDWRQSFVDALSVSAVGFWTGLFQEGRRCSGIPGRRGSLEGFGTEKKKGSLDLESNSQREDRKIGDVVRWLRQVHRHSRGRKNRPRRRNWEGMGRCTMRRRRKEYGMTWPSPSRLMERVWSDFTDYCPGLPEIPPSHWSRGPGHRTCIAIAAPPFGGLCPPAPLRAGEGKLGKPPPTPSKGRGKIAEESATNFAGLATTTAATPPYSAPPHRLGRYSSPPYHLSPLSHSSPLQFRRSGFWPLHPLPGSEILCAALPPTN
jgi:hypothetical protein